MPELLHECQNCRDLFRDDAIVPIGEVKDLLQRVTPGEVMPSGECKKCGSLTHIFTRPDTLEDALFMVASEIRLLSKKVNEAIGEMRKKTNIEVKRLEYNRTKETLAAVQKLAELEKEGTLPEELQGIAGLIKGKMKKGKKDAENPEAGGS